MDSLKTNRKTFQFFFENAGYVVGERAKCAYALAKAEAELSTRRNLRIDWEPESDVDLSWDESGEITKKLHSGELQAMCCLVYRKCASCGSSCVVASLGGVIGSFDDYDTYPRVVEAELALEAMMID